jgi:excisionase family DNA binding protein
VSASADLGIDNDPLMTVSEVAAMLRVSKMTVYRLVHQGRIPCHLIGKSFRIPHSAAVTYLNRNNVVADDDGDAAPEEQERS